MIDPIAQSVSQYPFRTDHGRSDAHRSGSDRERARIASTVTIDLNSDSSDTHVVTVVRDAEPSESGRTRSNLPEPAVMEIEAQMADLPVEHQKYQVVSHLGRVAGFGEKGRILNTYL